MNEFRKPYEYTEEKRGSVLLFVLMLVVIDSFQAFINILPTYNNLKSLPIMDTAFIIISILYLASIIFTALICYNLHKNMIMISKIYLVMRSIYFTFCIVIIFINNVDFTTNIAFDIQYDNAFDIYYSRLILPLFVVLSFSIGWYIYFVKSKRIKELVHK